MKKLLIAVLALGMFTGCASEPKGATIEVASDTVEIPFGSQQIEWKQLVYDAVTVTSADGTEIPDNQLFLKGAVNTGAAGEYPLTLVITENDVRTEKDITLVVKEAE